ncbi:ABC transporter ATP-binding protein [Egicoccus halophilus]|uniref:ABC-type quaternary amine transporter n=1 Tax=Egicoccus halophilus TaxID=1670830 RepID=A0A8J3EU39_9ACTN|nr:ABC transporter ATP-binding protein [Egicoccus halophilus]GGI05132.1 ABC transporter ATP-binding protein [Egicoccus halophilus]
MTAPHATRTDADAALVVAGLHKRFGGTVAVDHLDLVVPRGSLTAMLGPSGCGKTTALRTIAGLLAPDAGSIAIDGRLVAGPGTFLPPERRRIGMVFQDYALFPHLSVARNVAYGLTGCSRSARRRRVAEVLDLVDLGGYGDRLPVALSGGQQQRVALARALAPEPGLVLLDEPFSNLDAALRATVREDVRAILRAAEATAVFVTHDQEEALSLADRVAVVHRGRIHQVADPQTLYTRPASRFVAEFVGEADVLPGTRADRFSVDTPLGRLGTTRALGSASGAVVVRPESLRLARDDAGSAVVTAIAYFGHDQLVQVRLADGRLLRARRGPAMDLRRGDRVEVSVEGPVVVFDDEPAPAPAVLAPA